MRNRWINALVKTLVTVVVLHVIFLIGGWLFGNEIGWFNMSMIWAHWHQASDITLGLIGVVLLYCGIYAWGTDGCEIESKDA